LIRALAVVAMNQDTTLVIPRVFGFGCPFAPLVLTQARTGPKDATTGWTGDSRQVWTRPMKENFGV
jgi:hypothetical protein